MNRLRKLGAYDRSHSQIPANWEMTNPEQIATYPRPKSVFGHVNIMTKPNNAGLTKLKSSTDVKRAKALLADWLSIRISRSMFSSG
jgi:hypothetical protein